MKLPSIVISLFASMAFSCYSRADGTIVAKNSFSAPVTISVDGNAVVAGITAASGIYVEILYQPYLSPTAPNEFSPVNSYGWSALPIPIKIGPGPGGVFSTGILTLPGIADGANVWLEAVAWNNNATGLTDALSGTSSYFGVSTVWSQATGGSDFIPPTTPVSIAPYFSGLELTPYQAPEGGFTLAFFAIGICGLFAFSRQNRPA